MRIRIARCQDAIGSMMRPRRLPVIDRGPRRHSSASRRDTIVKPRRGKKARAVSDDLSPAELAKHVENLHGVTARFVEAVEVKEEYEGQTVWEGAVKVFDVTGHPSGATRAYAWSYPTEGGKRRFVSVLGVSPVDDATAAVRTVILAEVRAMRSKN
jgi:hypothetical protein